MTYFGPNFKGAAHLAEEITEAELEAAVSTVSALREQGVLNARVS